MRSEVFNLLRLLAILAVATHALNHEYLLRDQMVADRNAADNKSIATDVSRQRLVNHVSLILCHLNVKSIHVFYEDALKSEIVTDLLRGNRICAPPIVTLIKLVANLFYSLYLCVLAFDSKRFFGIFVPRQLKRN